MRNQLHLSLLTCLALCMSSSYRCFGALANAWHIPDNTDNLTFNMRNPEFEVGTNTTITIYQGVQKWTDSWGDGAADGPVLPQYSKCHHGGDLL
jgi:hypothetical protein